MAKDRKFYTEYPEDPPDWYWEAGLHDACIIGAEAYEFPFDYNKYTSKKNKYDRNMFLLKIDAKGALYDFGVKEIRFFNYKILSDGVELSGRKKIWWLADQLIENNGKYELDILLEDLNSYPEQFHFILRFDRAEVDRK